MESIKETIINQMKEKNGNLIIMTDFELGACIDKAIEMHRKENAVDPFGVVENICDLFAECKFVDISEESIINDIVNSGLMRGLMINTMETLVANGVLKTDGKIGEPQTKYSLSKEMQKQYLINQIEEEFAEA